MKNYVKKLLVLAIICSITIQSHVNLAHAASKSKVIDDTLRFVEYGDYGATLWTIVQLYSKGTEWYTTTSSKVKYTKRSLYTYAKVTMASGKITYTIVPMRHLNGSEVKNSFTWKKADAIFPDCNYCKSIANGTDVSYKKSNQNKSEWNVIVAVDSAFNTLARTGSISLYYSCK